MARNLDPKCKQCRRIGEKLFLKGDRCYSAKCAIVKRNYPPGIHGQKSKVRKTTSFAKQLREKQKAKKIFGLLEKQFRKYYETAKKTKGNIAENLLKLLNFRFDNLVYLGGFANSRNNARLLITQGHFLINGKKNNIPSYQIKIGQIINVAENKKKNKYWQEALPKLSKKERPDYLVYDDKVNSLMMVSQPEIKNLQNLFDPTLIIEFYSK